MIYGTRYRSIWSADLAATDHAAAATAAAAAVTVATAAAAAAVVDLDVAVAAAAAAVFPDGKCFINTADS